MSATLRRLLSQPNGALAAKAFIDHENYVRTALLTEQAISDRILACARGAAIPELEAIAAINRGLAAARRKPS